MLSAILLFILTVVIYAFNFRSKRRKYVEAINKFKGPPTVPILGNVLDVLGPPKGEYYLCNSQDYFIFYILIPSD